MSSSSSSSSSYSSSLSRSHLRHRKGSFRPLDANLGPFKTQFVDAPSIRLKNELDYDDDDDPESWNIKVDFFKLANMVKDRNNDYLDEVGGVDQMAQLLGSNTVTGIPGDANDLRRRRHTFGSNAYLRQNQPRKRVSESFVGFCLTTQWFLTMFPVITLGTVVCFFQDAILILTLIGLTAVCLAFELHIYPRVKNWEKLLNETDKLKSNVVRDGQTLQIPAHEVVVGDVVLLKRGDQVPADGLSLEAEKTYYMGSDLIEVEATRMLITSVGETTEFGQKMNNASIELAKMTEIFTTIFLLHVWWFIQKMKKSKKNQQSQTVEIVVPIDNDTRFSGLDLEGIQKLSMERNYESLNNQFGGVEGVVKALQSDRQYGINGTASDLYQRISLFGSNTFHSSHKRAFLPYLLKAMISKSCLNVWVSQAFSLSIKFKKHGPQEWWVLALAIFLVTICVAVVQAEIARRRHPDHKLKDYVKAQVRVVRNGRWKCISLCDVVVGDIVQLRKGSLIPSDGLFLDGGYLQMEGTTTKINQENPFMLFGGKVSCGLVYMVVTCVGEQSSWGKTMNSVTSLDPGTHKPLQIHFKRLLSLKETLGLFSVPIIPLILLVRCLLGRSSDDDSLIDIVLALYAATIKYLLHILADLIWSGPIYKSKFGRGIDQVLKNESSNTFDWMIAGRVTTIVTDEESILMQNHMEVLEFRLNGDIITNVVSETQAGFLEALQLAVCLQNPNASVVSPTEEILSSWGKHELGVSKTELMSTYIIENFDSSDENISWAFTRKENNAERARYLHCRGDAEKILSKCSNYHEKDGTKKPLDVDTRVKLEQVIGDMKANGLICVALAHRLIMEGAESNEEAQVKDDGREEQSNTGEAEEDHGGRTGGEVDEEKNDLTLLGIVGLGPSVRKSVNSLQNMGVHVIMVWSKDDGLNAVKVARECGIVKPNQNEDEVVVEAEAFRNCSDEVRKMEMVRKMCVMVRSSSAADKSELVEYLKRNDEVVAFIGRHETDVHVLEEADVGFSVQLGSAEVIKERADFLILDDKFTSLVMALKFMRYYYINFIKSTQAKLVVNIPGFILNLVAAIFSGKTPIGNHVLLCFGNVFRLSLAWGLFNESGITEEEQLRKLHVGRSGFMIPIKVIGVVRGSLLTIILLFLHFIPGETLWCVKKKFLMLVVLFLVQNFPWKKSDLKVFAKRLLFMILFSLVLYAVETLIDKIQSEQQSHTFYMGFQ